MKRSQVATKPERRLVYISPELHKKIRVLAAEKDAFINDVMEEVASAGLRIITANSPDSRPSAN